MQAGGDDGHVLDEAGTRQTYVIGSGWWCTDDEEKENPHRKINGTDAIREAEFFRLWLSAIDLCADPQRVVVVDSHAPLKPDTDLCSRVDWVELPFNARHATAHLGRWSGWTRSVMVSAQYALASDVDYFVYVEQDCLVSGAGAIEQCIAAMNGKYMFGDGAGTPQPIQQSFFLLRKDGISEFLNNIARIRRPDSEVTPEWKFCFATKRWLSSLANISPWIARSVFRVFFPDGRGAFDKVPFGYGRSRPVNMNKKFFYFQHGTAEEIDAYKASVRMIESPWRACVNDRMFM